MSLGLNITSGQDSPDQITRNSNNNKIKIKREEAKSFFDKKHTLCISFVHRSNMNFQNSVCQILN
jgi:hypothetical protein